LDAVCGQEKKVVARSVVNQKYFLPGLLSATFHGRDIFAPVAACLAKGRARPEDLGPVIAYRPRLKLPVVKKSRNRLKGVILYFDRFGNAITNICRSDAREKFWAEAEVRVRGHVLGKLRKTYGDWARTAGALFGSADRLEIAYPCGSARKKIPLKAGEEVTVTATVEASGC
ncbi:MAG: SAM-dependent chlorinase/fluorinase, partial [Candidatus Omnitrophica bacterium]|nr:SAM-dependent chlorinase/fluorinase [Candidatus Omnitrophota bacterium]